MIISSVFRQLCIVAAAAGMLVVGADRLSAQNASVQLIHNSPDAAVRLLDVYLGGTLIADSLLFRIATPYQPVASGTQEVGLAPVNSAGPQDIFKSIPVTLEPSKQYVLVIGGLLDPDSFKANPDGLPTDLTVLVAETKNTADQAGTSDYLFINGATDASALSFLSGANTIAQGVAYGSASGYVAHNEFVYTMSLAPTTAEARLLSFFDLDVGFLQNQAFTLLTSGYVNIFENSAGPRLKLLIVAADGFSRSITATEIPEDLATMQIVNNSPDVDQLPGYDVLFDGGLAINNLLFRGTTPVFGVPPGVNLQIDIADSTGSQIFTSTVLSTEAGRNYLVMVNGLVDPSAYLPNPDGRPTNLSLTINPNIRRQPDGLGVGEYVFSNGVTDATSLDLEVTGIDPVVGLPYGEMSGYSTLSEFEPLIELWRNGTPLPPMASHIVSIPFVLGSSFVMFASGFDQPDENGSIPIPAQLMLALQNGAVVQVRAREVVLPFASLQVIHASPDPSLGLADVYLDTFLVADDAPFRSGTAFLDVFAGKTVTLGLAPSTSTGFRDIVDSRRLLFESETSSAAVVRGLLDPDSFAPNPDGLDTGIDVHLIPNTLESGPDASQLTVLVANEVTDSPTFDVFYNYDILFANDLSFSESGSYGVVAPTRLAFDFHDAATGDRVVRSFVDFSGLPGRAGILLSTGFMDSTAANQQDQPFSTFLMLEDGTARSFDRIFTSVEDEAGEIPAELSLQGAYPNPFSAHSRVVFDLPQPSTVSLDVFDVTGRRVGGTDPVAVPAGTSRSLEFRPVGLASGVYFYRLTAAAGNETLAVHGEFMLVR